MQMKKKKILLLATLAGSLLTALLVMAGDRRATYKPKDGYVPNAETAMRIAEAVWIPIYGAKVVEAEKPFRAQLLKDKTWLVEGSWKESTNGTGGIVFGGVALAEIAKDDGRIIRVIHGK